MNMFDEVDLLTWLENMFHPHWLVSLVLFPFTNSILCVIWLFINNIDFSFGKISKKKKKVSKTPLKTLKTILDPGPP